ncbi:hypothetical protein DPO64_17520 [Salmonella enterica subsp. enterica serovar Schwarzengrund]|uniref:DUF551 domain-containing protein n=2 Tax=Salmonella enterica TaxID=28901 RepID=A0A5U9QR81_SALET|nr:hypothetical protein [Salmonella enterica]EBR9806885.1 hypothetical protein [Salmonella enterica subsp. enterica serovar Schwarzengrund]EBW1341575.1 hypothetical protein [Salmonella enterica subsp. enterica serovar Hadar]EDT1631785.1 hypothetical protein [Salmonella enterica subsp. enterica]EGQ7484048.1 hypothetical protein [Salmonella enterica subsp. enterica serovar Altona]EAO9939688.1 hypothetical protein [Salmonella enterica]
MTTITKERLLKIQHWRETYGAGSNVMLPAAEAEELARIALASLGAEPVLYSAEETLAYAKHGELHLTCLSEPMGDAVIPLYRHAPPAPVSVPDAMDDHGGVCCEVSYADGWNACRAAMLQAEPVSNSDELPLDYLQGHKDGLEWAAQLAEANHPQTGDWLYDDPIDLARAIRKGPDMPTVQAGNSPVTPDGWVMVPKEPTQAMIKAWLSEIANFRGHAAGYRAALEAAPQQEVNRG